MALIEAEHIRKEYPLRRGARVLLGRGGLRDWLAGRRRETFAALDDVSFTVEQGEAVGVIGANGSGKSTLLKILAGVTQPTSGRAAVHGRVASLLELGAGFHPMLTGRENIYLNAGLLGLRRRDTDAVFDAIVNFADIGPFLDNPVDTYSSGMYVRLGFAVAVHSDPDVFLVDEVLSVGDESFQRKCRERIGELREQGKTIVFVSHDLNIVNTLCERVFLLSKGSLISRGGSQETIDYYLRQTGSDEGVHVMRADGLEAVFSHGRVSVYRHGREVTAPGGLHCFIDSMGTRHVSTQAAWQVVDKGAAHCRARGVMPRLPVTLWWDVSIAEGALHWRIDAECARAVEIAGADAHVHLPTRYRDWLYGDLEGVFPDIEPGDVTWADAAAPEATCREAAIFPEDAQGDGTALPPVDFALASSQPYLRMTLSNTDFITGCRVLQAGIRIPSNERPTPAGTHELVTLRMDMEKDAAAIRERARQGRVVTSGPLAARFDNGRVRLSYEGEELTQFFHVYAAILSGNLWNDSANLQWETVERDNGTLRATGAARRFPFRQHWTLRPVDKGVALEIVLEVLEPWTAQEYHTSVVLRAEYERWATEHESGAFPEFHPSREHWVHANRDYTPGRWITALSSSLPSVTLENTSELVETRMTALNTSYHSRSRVIQALCAPQGGEGAWTFEPGRWVYFEGVLSAAPAPGEHGGGPSC